MLPGQLAAAKAAAAAAAAAIAEMRPEIRAPPVKQGMSGPAAQVTAAARQAKRLYVGNIGTTVTDVCFNLFLTLIQPFFPRLINFTYNLFIFFFFVSPLRMC